MKSSSEVYTAVVDDIKAISVDAEIVSREIEHTVGRANRNMQYVSNALGFYTMESHALLAAINSGNQAAISVYIHLARNYIDVNDTAQPKKGVRVVCSICKNDRFDVVNNTTHICQMCGNQKDLFNISPSFKDSSRINTSIRYTYKRKIHFKDCINQYQGKQNSSIGDDVYNNLRDKIAQYQLKMEDVTKDHILMFLKDDNNTKYYEDINLIYRTLTGKPVDDIGYLEDILVHDFNVLSDLYDKRFKQTNRIARKSFINTQYILFQLLKRHNHKCKREDFNILKTVDRKSLHEDILSELFDELGWNFTSLF
jgi:uncharacterized protein YihD (DUF1040 family)